MWVKFRAVSFSFSIVMLGLLATACGGGSGPGSSSTATLSDTTAPTVLSTSPASSSRNVAARAPISVTFSRAMDASSLTATTFVVSAGTTPIAGALSITSNSATFIPAADLDLNTIYTASVTTDVKDTAGNPLSATYTWQFTPGTRLWSTARRMATDAFAPQTATDGAGNVIMVWQQKEGNRYNIWANRYDIAARQWGLATLLQTNNTGSGYVPQLAVNANGHAVVAWYHYDGNRYHVWVNQYDAILGQWGVVQALTDNTADAFDPQVAISANGNAVVVWRGQDGPYDDPATPMVTPEYYVSSLWAKHYNAGTKTWESVATTLESDNLKGHDASAARVAMDGNGNALVVWHQFDGTVTNTYATRYIVGSGWAVPGEISTASAGVAMYPQLSMDSSGNAIAVWQQYDASAHYSIWASRYVATTLTWGVPVLIENDNTGDARDPQIAVNSTGNAWVAWRQQDGTLNNLWGNTYTVATGWSNPVLLETNNTGDTTHVHVAANASGEAFVVWEQSDGTRTSVWSNRYNPTLQAWSSTTLVEVDDIGDALMPQVAVDGNGNATTVWRQWDGAQWKVFASRYQ